ncbi:MAG: EVE domain-containing protein [Methylovulum sp.]
MNYWLMKSEPNVFSLDDLRQRPQQLEPWDGVRNYQARNMMRDEMRRGDQVFFYHSNCEQPGIVGIMDIARAGYPDFSAHDQGSKYFDSKSTPDKPRWFMVDVQYVRHLKRVITLKELKDQPPLQDFPLIRRGNRLSIMPVSPVNWAFILSLEEMQPLR